jgi:tryptophan synthase alpha chain
VKNRIERRFGELRQRGGKAFIPYLMAGAPSLVRTRELVGICEACGADIIELGVPFSDPLADGPTIQDAAQTALRQGVTLGAVLDLVSSLRSRTQIPIVLMTYYNPVFKYGEDRFVGDASAAGVDGVIVPDLPPDEAAHLIRISKKAGFDTIFLLAPTSTEERIGRVAAVSRGFIYYVSMTGITGSKLSLDASIGDHIGRIRRESDKPVAIGFGVSTPDEARTVASYGDGVIIGSAVVRRTNDPDEELSDYLRSLRSAIQ